MSDMGLNKMLCQVGIVQNYKRAILTSEKKKIRIFDLRAQIKQCILINKETHSNGISNLL